MVVLPFHGDDGIYGSHRRELDRYHIRDHRDHIYHHVYHAYRSKPSGKSNHMVHIAS